MGRGNRFFLETVSIAAVEAERAAVVAKHFTAGEAAPLARRHVRSTAGILALKRALAALGSELLGVALTERDFVVGHTAAGAPRVAAAPAGLPLDRVLVSISHTRTWAYGLAVLAEHGGA